MKVKYSYDYANVLITPQASYVELYLYNETANMFLVPIYLTRDEKFLSNRVNDRNVIHTGQVNTNTTNNTVVRDTSGTAQGERTYSNERKPYGGIDVTKLKPGVEALLYKLDNTYSVVLISDLQKLPNFEDYYYTVAYNPTSSSSGTRTEGNPDYAIRLYYEPGAGRTTYFRPKMPDNIPNGKDIVFKKVSGNPLYISNDFMASSPVEWQRKWAQQYKNAGIADVEQSATNPRVYYEKGYSKETVYDAAYKQTKVFYTDIDRKKYFERTRYDWFPLEISDYDPDDFWEKIGLKGIGIILNFIGNYADKAVRFIRDGEIVPDEFTDFTDLGFLPLKTKKSDGALGLSTGRYFDSAGNKYIETYLTAPFPSIKMWELNTDDIEFMERLQKQYPLMKFKRTGEYSYEISYFDEKTQKTLLSLQSLPEKAWVKVVAINEKFNPDAQYDLVDMEDEGKGGGGTGGGKDGGGGGGSGNGNNNDNNNNDGNDNGGIKELLSIITLVALALKS